MEYEKLPKIGSTRDSLDKNCIVPFIDGRNNSTKEESNKYDKSVPDDLLLSLKQAEQPKEYLGPPSKKAIVPIKPAVPLPLTLAMSQIEFTPCKNDTKLILHGTHSKDLGMVRKPDNAWNYEKQREKFKFLTEQPICSCGAGKDISFIYDCALHQPNIKQPPSKYDLSAIRVPEQIIDKPVVVPETIIPDEYKVVKNQGVWPLKYDENNFTTVSDDHLNHLTVFPSLKPTSRTEVIQLKHTMDALLKRVGADIIDQKGPTQLHNLLEIIKQEQDIYNIVFHEIIRQVTVECKDRGEILAKLRERYASLLSRVPREIRSLHEEVVAQRALDRRLTEELMQFKLTIQQLTDELTKVKEHDKKIGDQATVYQKDLEKALNDAQKNASLLGEYHQLYELQRKRLEKTIQLITDERELWIKTAYCIALKVTDENDLNTSKRLNIAEKSWSKQALHFALLLSETDTKVLIELQKLIENWKDILLEVRQEITAKEIKMKKTLDGLKNEVNHLRHIFSPSSFSDSTGKLLNVPDNKKSQMFYDVVRGMFEILSKEIDNFTGDSVLINEEKMKKEESILFQLGKIHATLTERHEHGKDLSNEPKHIQYEKLQKDMKRLHDQYRVRSTGDNGLLRNILALNNGFDHWQAKLAANTQDKLGKNKAKLTESEWILFYQSFDEWIEVIGRTINFIGKPMTEENQPTPTSGESAAIKPIDHDDLINELHQWLATFCHFIDSQDSFITEEVSVYHNKMVHWMIETLIYLAPDNEDISEEARVILYDSISSIEEIEKIAQELTEKVQTFTNSLVSKCGPIVEEEENTVAKSKDKTLKKESDNLKDLQNDCQEWIYVVKLILGELKGDKGFRFNHNANDRHHQNKDYEHEIDLSLDDSQLRDKSFQHTEQSSENFKNTARDTDQERQSTALEQEQPRADQSQQEFAALEQRQIELKSQTEPGDLEDANTNNNLNIKKENSKSHLFEILAGDLNTEKKFLDNINFTEPDHLSEAELKSTMFNAFKTIESLQQDLIVTEERAQKSESRIAELELELRKALEKIRILEKNPRNS